MERRLSEEEAQQEAVISRNRQGALFLLGLCLLLLLTLPHPHGGIYQVVSGNTTTTGNFPGITNIRGLIGIAAWGSVVAYVVMPLYVRRFPHSK